MTDNPDTPDTTGTGQDGFRGWPADALAFLAELEQDNSRGFWMANVHRFRAALLEPTRALAGELAAEFGPPRVFRPHVDRRFRPYADPYRTDTGATVAGTGGTPHAVVLSTRGLAVQVGYQLFDTDQLRRYRAAVDGDPGEVLVDVLAELHGAGLSPYGVPALTSRPRGCPPDHPRLPLMRLRGLHVDRLWAAGPWLETDVAVERVRTAWQAAAPLALWLGEHVGLRTEYAGRRSSDAAESGDPAVADTADHGTAHSARPGGVDTV
jgi:uncharacterized protein (DUF2461 family)